ncbi:hypothetical protein TIFTF001_011412 [Ficus carica]|uniref:Uncharacterized protein n=1 Tax=Ficus carica TaxID=3494 RepID=A0AA87ZX46_FICCA|nr:hypothetical protein TIFTF001_011412 [Ficus carica]
MDSGHGSFSLTSFSRSLSLFSLSLSPGLSHFLVSPCISEKVTAVKVDLRPSLSFSVADAFHLGISMDPGDMDLFLPLSSFSWSLSFISFLPLDLRKSRRKRSIAVCRRHFQSPTGSIWVPLPMKSMPSARKSKPTIWSVTGGEGKENFVIFLSFLDGLLFYLPLPYG